MSQTRQDILDAAASAFSGLSLTTTLNHQDMQDAVDAAVAAMDAYQYTINPNSTHHPSSIRR